MKTIIDTQELITNFYTYEGVVKALNRVSLVVDHGMTFGLVGESGCGKSVTVRSMMRIVQEPGKVEGGKVILFLDDASQAKGIDLLKQSEAYMEDLRGDRISMIFQEPNAALNPIMSIGDQVNESYLFHQQKEIATKVIQELDAPECKTFFVLKSLQQVLYARAAKNPDGLLLQVFNRIPLLRRWRKRMHREASLRSEKIIANLGIPNPAEVMRAYPHNLSGGMKQRIVIAIALACNPLLLIADEATSNLDVTIQAQILELLKTLKQEEISSVLLITHDLGIVAETCDRIGVMYAGNLCEVADVKELFRAPQHPYTRALLNSVPRFSQEGELQSIAGNVPNLVTPPPGCRFHPRCPHVKEICRKRFPEQVTVSERHDVACYLYTNKPRVGI